MKQLDLTRPEIRLGNSCKTGFFRLWNSQIVEMLMGGDGILENCNGVQTGVPNEPEKGGFPWKTREEASRPVGG